MAQIANYIKRRRATEYLDNILGQIEHLYFKGAVVADLYPQPALRSMGDVDVLIHESDRELVHHILINNGFVFSKESDIVWIYKRDIITFEIHTQLIHPFEE